MPLLVLILVLGFLPGLIFNLTNPAVRALGSLVGV